MVSDSVKNMPKSNDADLLKQFKKIKDVKKNKGDTQENNEGSISIITESQANNKEKEPESGEKYIGSWNELGTTNFVDNLAKYDPDKGEVLGPITTALALSRKVGKKEQRIMILGDADCFSNGEFSRNRNGIMAENFRMATGMFFWLSNNEVPIDVRRPAPPDNKIYLEKKDMAFPNALYKVIIPVLIVLVFLLIWLRRKGR